MRRRTFLNRALVFLAAIEAAGGSLRAVRRY
jgi:hypothetical protein